MPTSPSDWLTIRDVEAIMNDQHIVLTALFERNVLDTVTMPRHLLEKHSTMFANEFEKEDLADPAKCDKILEFSMNDLWESYFPDILGDVVHMHDEWTMLKLFFKWMWLGEIVEAPVCGLEEEVSWSPAASAAFRADVARWVMDHDETARQAPAA